MEYHGISQKVMEPEGRLWKVVEYSGGLCNG
jgi:hypothetical protein